MTAPESRPSEQPLSEVVRELRAILRRVQIPRPHPRDKWHTCEECTRWALNGDQADAEWADAILDAAPRLLEAAEAVSEISACGECISSLVCAHYAAANEGEGV